MKTKWIAGGMLVCSIFLSGCETPTDDSGKAPADQATANHDIDQPTDRISADEQAFNESGSAKAIVSETDLWPIFEDKATGFVINYPQDYVLVDDKNFQLNAENHQLRIAVNEIGTQNRLWDPDREAEMKNIEDLAGGEFGMTGENAVEASKKVAMVGNIFAQDLMVLGRIDICNVTLERMRIFYFNNKRIEVTAYGSVPQLKKTMPEFFVTDEPNCGDEQVWNIKTMDQVYDRLASGKAAAEIQQWYDNFDRMMDTLEFLQK